MTDEDLRHIERSMIADDASFMVGMFITSTAMPGKSGIPFLFSSIDFYSLIVYETYLYYSKYDHAFAAQLKHKYEDDIKQSRQRIKIFDDKRLGIEGIGSTLIETISPAHQKEVSKTHRLKLPKWMWQDVSVYYLQDNPKAIGSTHLASFNLGFDVVRMFDPVTPKSFGTELGRFLISISKGITAVRLPSINVITGDMRSENLYTEKKYGSTSQTINAGLSIIDMNMNFASLCLPPSYRHTTLFKWKYLITYHAISSLQKLLHSTHSTTLNSATVNAIESILNTDFAKLMETEGATMLRNTLTHFGIDSRMDRSKLNQHQREYYGLIEASLPGWNYEKLATELDGFIGRMENLFATW